MFIAVRMNVADDQGSRACLMNTGENSLHSGLAWASDGVLPWSSPLIVSWHGARQSFCSSGLAWASDGVLPCSSVVTPSWQDAGWSSCSSGLAWASDGLLPCSSPLIVSRQDAERSSCSSGLAWASDSVLPCSSPLIVSRQIAGWSSCSSGLAWASDSVLPCSSLVTASLQDAGWSSCSSGLGGASSGEAGWPAKLLTWLADLMRAGDSWRSRLPVLATSRLAVTVFCQCMHSCDWCWHAGGPHLYTFIVGRGATEWRLELPWGTLIRWRLLHCRRLAHIELGTGVGYGTTELISSPEILHRYKARK
jgi:hypothetical protein